MRLEAIQQAMTAAIMGGPDFIPEGVFAGERAAMLRGLAVHANTVSHARLVALEESFPRTRQLLGDGEFNRLSRRFVETPLATAEPLALIGRHFPAFLGDGEAGALACFEWTWLDAFHAAEAEALPLAGLAGLDEAALLVVTVQAHPAARMVDHVAALEAEVPGLDHAEAILLTRPGAEVLVSPATRAMVALFAPLDTPRTVADLLGGDGGEEENLAALLVLIEAGGLVRAEPGSGSSC